MTKADIRVLLLSIREEATTLREEHLSFARYCDLAAEQIGLHNVFEQPRFEEDVLDSYDALFIGGASEASVLEPERYPFVEDCQRLIRHCVETDFPVFASCFGFQLAVLALGGEIVRDRVRVSKSA